MTALRTTFAVALAATLWVALTVSTSASDELNRAKELYRSASYDEALGVLDAIPSGASAPEAIEVHEYRVLCLVALDRKDDAKKAMSALITDNPSYVMSEAEASPRVRSMFTDVRRALLPSLVQRAYADAKAAFDAKDPAAIAKFDRVLALLRDPDVAGNPGLADMATVAAGFRDLSKAMVPPPAPAPAQSASAPAAPAPPVLVPPVVISQPVPIPQLRETREWNGEIEVTINERGRVIAARMTAPIHPIYDQQLVRAAMNWTYKPALKDGAPTLFMKIITIHVDTRPECSARVSEPCRSAAAER